MIEKEQIFWNRVLTIAKEKLTKRVYEYYITDLVLHGVDNGLAKIIIPSDFHRIFLAKNLQDIIIMAGFEVFDQEIRADYILAEETPIKEQEKTEVDKTTLTLPNISSNIKPQYTFENFIMGEGNRWALGAAIGVSQDPGNSYNPLFIYGGPGLGKTHLLNAIGNSILDENPNARLLYITAEEFLNEFTKHIQTNTGKEFQEKFRTLDLLLIDDIQFLARRNLSGTQEEFFHTFDALHKSNKQIVLTSDRTPNELKELQERIVSRFSWGLTVDITPPDFETRIAILNDKIKDFPYHFPSDSIKYLASQFNSNVRELEGALKDINLIATMQELGTISIDTIAQAIRARKNQSPQTNAISIETIQAEVGRFYNVTTKEIKSAKRTQDIALARQVAMFLTRELTEASLPAIGKAFGGRDHTTVLHAYRKIKNMLEKDEALRLEIENLQNKIR